jgi:hypothetical protein
VPMAASQVLTGLIANRPKITVRSMALHGLEGLRIAPCFCRERVRASPALTIGAAVVMDRCEATSSLVQNTPLNDFERTGCHYSLALGGWTRGRVSVGHGKQA